MININRYVIVGLGEALWDVLPDGVQLGGAPANFAYHTAASGDAAYVVSRVGKDELGTRLIEQLTSLGMNTDYVQLDDVHPTGTVRVSVDANGQPSYRITPDVAWDYLAWSDELAELARRADTVCWGTLAQRADVSRATIRRFAGAMRPDSWRIFDANLRQDFYSAMLIDESLRLSNVIKLNDEELPRVIQMLKSIRRDVLDENTAAATETGIITNEDNGEPADAEEENARWLLRTYNLRLVCVTRGNRGSLVVTESESYTHAGYAARVVDTVGAGDAFTATTAHHLLRGSSLAQLSEAANRVGAYLASQRGAMPPVLADKH